MSNYGLQNKNEELPYAALVSRQPAIAAAIFQPFGTQHLAVLAVIAGLCALVAWLARNAASRGKLWLRALLGGTLLAYTACAYIQQGISYGLGWDYSLPLELCNCVLIACLISLFHPNRFTSEIAYFWGLGGVLQATLTPDLAQGFPSWDFALFFWGHGATLLAIVFLLFSRELRPRKGSILRMMAAINIYAVVVGLIDAIAGWNYGYLCRKPAMPSLLDILGPWPWYLVSLELIAFLTFLILNLILRLMAYFGMLREPPATDISK